MERLSGNAIDIVNDLHRDRLDYNSEYLPIINALNKLAEYEDAEENGTFVKLPCKVGDTVYEICGQRKAGEWVAVVKERIVETIEVLNSVLGLRFGRTLWVSASEIGKTVFLTREEAEEALEEYRRRIKR